VIFDNRDSGLSHIYSDFDVPSLEAFNEMMAQGQTFIPPYALQDMAHDIILLMDQLEIDQAHLAGISMGGMISQVFALQFPTRILSLICIASTTGDTHLPPPAQAVLDFFSSPKRSYESFESFIESKVYSDRIYNHPEYFDAERARAYNMRAYQRAYHPQGFMRQLYAVICATPRGTQLQSSKIPSLIIHGTHDPVFSLAHGEYLAQILKCKLTVVDKMGHSLLEQFSEQIAQAMIEQLK
jgi:pimeloyl-ACP methyl ester carboxylesterase